MLERPFRDKGHSHGALASAMAFIALWQRSGYKRRAVCLRGKNCLTPCMLGPGPPMACATYSSPAAATPIQWHGASAAPSHRRITRTACTSARHHAAAQVPAPAKHGLLPSRTRCYFDT
jgi:hypothetical protein